MQNIKFEDTERNYVSYRNYDNHLDLSLVLPDNSGISYFNRTYWNNVK